MVTFMIPGRLKNFSSSSMDIRMRERSIDREAKRQLSNCRWTAKRDLNSEDISTVPIARDAERLVEWDREDESPTHGAPRNTEL
jgi:hypothetical protein